MSELSEPSRRHTVESLIREDLNNGTFHRPVCTRFPPEPNGYLHIGSAYAIHTNYTAAEVFGGRFHLRLDDTNPLKEDMEYVRAIIEDIRWLGYDPGDAIFFGSDYSEEIYNKAVQLIQKGKAYVCDLSPEEMTAYRGTLTEPGQDSPWRSRSVADNLRLFEGMRDGRDPAGSRVLRAKIDMSSPNLNLRDPVLYRIIHAPHYRTGDAWCIYPMYDFAHPIQDAIEGITHSLCSIEFKDHRPLYEWVLRELEYTEPPRQWEFGRVNMTGVVTSKRYLKRLVESGRVDGWDDPRLPTLRGLRRRGFTPSSIRRFVAGIGSVRHQTVVDFGALEQTLRQELMDTAVQYMAVLRPLKVVITNYPEGAKEWLEIGNNPRDKQKGKRTVPFSNTVYIEQDDFMEFPESGFHRLSPGGEVRLKGAYFIRCDEVVKDASGHVTELRCSYDPETKSGSGFTGRKVKSTIHWIAEGYGVPADVHLYEPLFVEEQPVMSEEDWEQLLNPHSLTKLHGALLEAPAAALQPGEACQWIRHGFFCKDTKIPEGGRPVFNRIVPLKDGWNRQGG